MEDAIKKQIEEFLDEFIKVEYRGHDHVLARAHYRDVFNELIPKYFAVKENGLQSAPEKKDEEK